MISLLVFCISFCSCLPLEVVKSSGLLKIQCLLVVGIIATSVGITADISQTRALVLGCCLAMPVRIIVGLFQYMGELIDWSRGQSMLEWSDPVSQQQLSSIGGIAGFVAWMWCFETLLTSGQSVFTAFESFSKRIYRVGFADVLQQSIDGFQYCTRSMLGLLLVGGLAVVVGALCLRYNSALFGSSEVAFMRWLVLVLWVVILGVDYL